MKKIIILLLLIILSVNFNLRAQSRFPIKTSSIWRINYEFPRYEWSTHTIGDEEYKYFIGGDTILSGIHYFKLLKSGILFLEAPLVIKNKYVGAIRDNENKFYIVEKNSESERLLYNFDAIVGGYMDDNNSGLLQISNIEVLTDGRKKYTFNLLTVHCGAANTVIEGIGWLGGLLEGNSCSGHPGVRGSYLVCYSEDGIAKYESDIALMYNLSCSDPTTSVSPIVKQDLKFSLNNYMLKVYSPSNSGEIEFAEIYNALGEKIMEEKVNLLYNYSINCKFLKKGLYLIKISCNGQPYTFKFMKD